MASYFCSVPSCQAASSKTRNSDPNVTFHPLPKTTRCRLLRAEWIRRMGRADSSPAKKWNYICSQHFLGSEGPTEENPIPVLFAHNDFGKEAVEKVEISANLKKEVERYFKFQNSHTAVHNVGDVGGKIDIVSQCSLGAEHGHDEAADDDVMSLGREHETQEEVPLAAICIPVAGQNQSFKLRLDGYPNWLLQEMYFLWKQEKFCDVTIKTSDGPCKAHRMVLSSQSEVMAQVLTLNQSSATSNITIDVSKADVSHSTMQEILNFFYTGSMKVTERTIRNIRQAAQKFKMEKVIAACNAYCVENELPAGDAGFVRAKRGRPPLRKRQGEDLDAGARRSKRFHPVETQLGTQVDSPITEEDAARTDGVKIKQEPEDMGYEAAEEISHAYAGEYLIDPTLHVKMEPSDIGKELVNDVSATPGMSGYLGHQLKVADLAAALTTQVMNCDPKDATQAHILGHWLEGGASAIPVPTDSSVATTLFGPTGMSETVQSTDPDGQYCCSVCGTFFASRDQCREHIEKEHDEKTSDLIEYVKTHKCELCGESFQLTASKFVHLARHMERVHNRKIDFQCSYCGVAMVKLADLIHHLRKLHIIPMTMMAKHTTYIIKPKNPEPAWVNSTTDDPFKFMSGRKVKPFCCTVCWSTLDTELDCIEHLKKHCIQESWAKSHMTYVRSMPCEHCNRVANVTTGTFDFMIKHLQDDHKTKVGLFCVICKGHFTRALGLLGHIHDKHKVETRFAIQYVDVIKNVNVFGNVAPILNKSDSSSETVAVPEKATSFLNKLGHSHVGPYCCKICMVHFRKEAQCVRHIKNTHKLGPDTTADKEVLIIYQAKCTVCGVTGNLLPLSCNVIMNHMLQQHSKQMGIQCSVCKATSYSNVGHFVAHMQKVHQVEVDRAVPYMLFGEKIVQEKCDLCDYKTSDMRRPLMYHKYFRHDIPLPPEVEAKMFHCPHCSWKGTGKKCHFETHLATHTGLKSFICEECGKGFTSAGNRRSHIRRLHSDTPLYMCDRCDFACQNHSDMVTHKRTHTKGQDWGCDQCEFTCTKSHHLRLHLLNKHDIVIPVYTGHASTKDILKYKLVAPSEGSEESTAADGEISDPDMSDVTGEEDSPQDEMENFD